MKTKAFIGIYIQQTIVLIYRMLAESFGRGDYCTKQIINNKKPN